MHWRYAGMVFLMPSFDIKLKIATGSFKKDESGDHKAIIFKEEREKFIKTANLLMQ